MKKSPTLLMKELKSIQLEIAQIHKTDETNSSVPVNADYEPRYPSEYSYEENRTRVQTLQKREAQIHSILNVFNMATKVEGYDLLISEALVKLAQLRSEIKVLTPLAEKTIIHSGNRRYGYSEEPLRCCYDVVQVKRDLRTLQQELSQLQVAVDKTNLNSVVEC